VGIGDASFRMHNVPFRMEKESENAPVKLPEKKSTRIAYDLPVIVPRIYRHED
jgi:hypothetical protein